MTEHYVRTSMEFFCPEMTTLRARLSSFEKWPSSKKQKPADLAACGFFYLGEEDRVRCFYCGIGLHDWISEDNVWLEHAINSNRCPFLLLNKKKALLGAQPTTIFDKIQVCFCMIQKNISIYLYRIINVFIRGQQVPMQNLRHF